MLFAQTVADFLTFALLQEISARGEWENVVDAPQRKFLLVLLLPFLESDVQLIKDDTSGAHELFLDQHLNTSSPVLFIRAFCATKVMGPGSP